MKYHAILAFCVAGLAFAGCSGSSSSTSAAGAPASGAAPNPAATNPTDFPLYNGATIVTTHPFTQTVNVSQMPGGQQMYPQGSGTYDGHQVVAGTTATMADLHSWLDELSSKPPEGYTVVAAGGNLNQARTQAQRYGLDFEAFRKQGGADVVVVVLDPATMNQRLGPALGLIEKFHSLPDALRGPIDQQIKQRTGMSASEALDPAAPVGAALAAYDSVKSSNGRAIVLIDASKH